MIFKCKKPTIFLSLMVLSTFSFAGNGVADGNGDGENSVQNAQAVEYTEDGEGRTVVIHPPAPTCFEVSRCVHSYVACKSFGFHDDIYDNENVSSTRPKRIFSHGSVQYRWKTKRICINYKNEMVEFETVDYSSSPRSESLGRGEVQVRHHINYRYEVPDHIEALLRERTVASCLEDFENWKVLYPLCDEQ